MLPPNNDKMPKTQPVQRGTTKPFRVKGQVKTSPESDWYVDVADGSVDGWSVVHKFGAANVGTTYTPVCEGGFYRTPQVAGATTLRIKAGGDANDTAAGTGAREVTLEGLNATGAEIVETIATNGASASTATTNSFIRLHRLYVSASGTYATQSTGSHVGDIVVENSAGTEDWATITSTDFARGQSQIAVYSIPTGKKGFIKEVFMSIDTNKSVDVTFFQRENILETAAPYTPMRLITEAKGLSGPFSLPIQTPINGFDGPCDIGFMAKVSTGTADLTVDFEILLKDEA